MDADAHARTEPDNPIRKQVREQSTVCRLYLCIAILVIVLVLLLVLGFT